jgi:hypothetical protein
MEWPVAVEHRLERLDEKRFRVDPRGVDRLGLVWVDGHQFLLHVLGWDNCVRPLRNERL